MEYYQILKDLRIDNDMTQKDISIILNTTQQQYQKYEAGKQELPLRHLRKLCILYNVSADYILGLPRNLKWPR